jgi:hypothetical protein
MAFQTFSLRDMAISLNNTKMAFLTSHPSGDILLVIEAPALDPDVTFRLDMTGGTTPYGTRNALLFPLLTSLVIVTDETIDIMNSQVFSLNKLTVA